MQCLCNNPALHQWATVYRTHPAVSLKLRLHDTTGCQTGLTTGCIMLVGWLGFNGTFNTEQARYDLFCVKSAVKPQPTNTIQPVVKPV